MDRPHADRTPGRPVRVSREGEAGECALRPFRYEFSREDAFRSLRETARLPHAVGPGSSADRSQLVNGAAIILAAVPSPGRGTKKLRQTRRLAHRYLGIEPGRRQGQVAFDDRDERQHGHSDRTDA